MWTSVISLKFFNFVKSECNENSPRNLFMKKRLVLVPFLGLILFSCSKELDFDMIDDIRIKTSATLPVASLTLNLEDLVSDIEDSTLVVDPDGALRIYYRQDSVFTYAIDDILSIPDQDPFPLFVNKSQPEFRITVGLGTIAGAELTSATFSSGLIALNVNGNDTAFSDIRLALTFYNATLNGSSYSDTFTLAAGTVDLLDSSLIDGLSFDFTNGNTGINVLDIGLKIIDTADVPSGAVYNCSVTLSQLGLDVASGYFGDRVQAAPPGSFDFEINGLENFSGGFYLTNPNLTLVTNSTVGLPIEITTDFVGENLELSRVSLDADPFNITASPSPGVVAVSNLSLNANNSKITDFLANIPQNIFYSGAIQINPNGRGAIENFIASTSEVVLDFVVDVPLELRLEDMRLDQTINDIAIGADNPDLLDEITLFFKTENRFPFDLDLAVSFVDSISGDSLGGFNLPLLRAAPVDANGRVSAANFSEIPIVFTSAQIDGFLLSDALRFIAKVNTTNGGQTDVKMYSDYDLKIQVASQIKANVTVSGE